MKFELNLNKLFVALLVAGSTFTLAACSNDNETPAIDQETETLLATVEGIYTGVATSNYEGEEFEESEDEPKAKITVRENTITIEALEELMPTIIKKKSTEEEIDPTIEFEYTRTINPETNEIILTLTPRIEEFEIEESVDGEIVKHRFRVVYEAEEDGIYNMKTQEMTFSYTVTELMLNDEPFEGFVGFKVNFEVTKINK
ncbi:MAG: hypothetical protein ACRCUJ_03755 [Phocaeicola sp.]